MILQRGIRRAPKHIVEALQRINPHLTVRWRDDLERWVLYERDRRGRIVPVRILEDINNGRCYEPLTMETVKKAALGDTWRRPRGMDSILDEIQARNDLYRKGMDADMAELCLDAAKYIAAKAAGRFVFNMARRRVHPAHLKAPR